MVKIQNQLKNEIITLSFRYFDYLVSIKNEIILSHHRHRHSALLDLHRSIVVIIVTDIR